jgi:hypothetical protein
VLVQDSAFMVAVPGFCPDVPPLKSNPVFLFYPDNFKRPNPFTADVIVATDSVIEKKADALACLVSQFYEGGALGSADLIPKDAAGAEKRKAQVREAHKDRDRRNVQRFRDKLVEFYGEERAAKVQFAEAFEVCEYGRQPTKAELHRLFPFFDK